MNILELFQTFKTQEQALDYLEQARWRGRPTCPYCQSEAVGRHSSGDRAQQRWQCRKCNRAFAVTVGTIFHRTHIPLKNWFLVLALMLNAKKSASACQIARDLGMRRPTVWSMMHRIRKAMHKDKDQARLLHGIIEADESFVGGKPRKSNKRWTGPQSGGGNQYRDQKTPVVGLVERNGRVVAKMAERGDLTSKKLSEFIQQFVDSAGSLLMTDEYPGYRSASKFIQHASVNHQKEYVNGMVHTNSIEGFWALIKRALYGQHHHYSKKYLDLYISEACYKYNQRKETNSFSHLVGLMVAV